MSGDPHWHPRPGPSSLTWVPLSGCPPSPSWWLESGRQCQQWQRCHTRPPPPVTLRCRDACIGTILCQSQQLQEQQTTDCVTPHHLWSPPLAPPLSLSTLPAGSPIPASDAPCIIRRTARAHKTTLRRVSSCLALVWFAAADRRCGALWSGRMNKVKSVDYLSFFPLT
jgi:hypothetical protein